MTKELFIMRDAERAVVAEWCRKQIVEDSKHASLMLTVKMALDNVKTDYFIEENGKYSVMEYTIYLFYLVATGRARIDEITVYNHHEPFYKLALSEYGSFLAYMPLGNDAYENALVFDQSGCGYFYKITANPGEVIIGGDKNIGKLVLIEGKNEIILSTYINPPVTTECTRLYEVINETSGTCLFELKCTSKSVEMNKIR